jgi:very-short-patch-repair endonuclease
MFVRRSPAARGSWTAVKTRPVENAKQTVPGSTLGLMPMICDGQAFTVTEARQWGLHRRAFDDLRRVGAIRPVVYGVYVDAHVADDLGTRAQALARVLPPDAVVCRRTAAWLYGVDAREPGRHHRVPRLDVAVPIGHQPIRRLGVRGFVQDLSARDITVVSGIPATAPLRTAVDLARWLPRRSAMACLDALLHLGLIDQRQLLEEVERFAGFAYVDQARDLADLAEPKAASFGESWLRLRIVDSGFPRFEPQIEIRDADGLLVFLIDLGLRTKKKGVEYDGEEHHSTAADVAHDESRRMRLDHEFGWEVIGFGRDAVLGRGHQLEEAVATLLGMAPERRAIPIQPPSPDDWDFTGERSRRTPEGWANIA